MQHIGYREGIHFGVQSFFNAYFQKQNSLIAGATFNLLQCERLNHHFAQQKICLKAPKNVEDETQIQERLDLKNSIWHTQRPHSHITKSHNLWLVLLFKRRMLEGDIIRIPTCTYHSKF